MPAGVHVLIDGDQAEVEVPDPVLRRRIAARLAAAAQPQSWRIRLVTMRRDVPTFIAPVDVVRKAGLIDEPATASPIPEPPRTGKGYTLDAWRAHLTAHGIPFDPGDNRRELVAAWDARRPT